MRALLTVSRSLHVPWLCACLRLPEPQHPADVRGLASCLCVVRCVVSSRTRTDTCGSSRAPCPTPPVSTARTAQYQTLLLLGCTLPWMLGGALLRATSQVVGGCRAQTNPHTAERGENPKTDISWTCDAASKRASSVEETWDGTIRKLKPWKHTPPVSKQEVMRMREEFWDTQPHYGGSRGALTLQPQPCSWVAVRTTYQRDV